MRVSKGYSSTVLAQHRDTWGFIGRFDGRVQVPNVLLILVPVPIATTPRSQKTVYQESHLNSPSSLPRGALIDRRQP